MVRLNPFIPRSSDTKAGHLGKILLFCEGTTEVNYFEFFAAIIQKNRNKYSHIDIVPTLAGGNARRVLNFANHYLNDDNNLRKYGLYEKCLIFDCDAPPEIEEAISEMQLSSHDYVILPSNLSFEIWLLMHFEDVNVNFSDTKTKIFERLKAVLGRADYEKSDKGMIRQIIGNGDSIRKAISIAQTLDQTYKEQGLSIDIHIRQMNPFTLVYTLMERILDEMHKSEL